MNVARVFVFGIDGERARGGGRSAFVGNDFAGECEYLDSWIAPSIRRQPGFATGCAQKFLAGEAMFGRDLRQEKSTRIAGYDDQAVTPDLDV